MKEIICVCIVLSILFIFALFKGMREEQEKIIRMDIVQYTKSKIIKSAICSSIVVLLFASRDDLKSYQFLLMIGIKVIVYTLAVLFVYGLIFYAIKKLNKNK